MAQRILRLPTVQLQTGLSRSSIYLAISRNEFPKQIALGARAVGWDSNSVQRWVQARIAGHSSEKIRALIAKIDDARSAEAA